MASISRDPKGNRCIQFIGADNRRRTIRLGKINQKRADAIKEKVEAILTAKFTGESIERATAEWIGRIDQRLHDKLAKAGLVQKRKSADQTALGPFLRGYASERSDVKHSTKQVYGHTRRCLIKYFGDDKPLQDITPGDADDWRRWLSRPVDKDAPKNGGQGLADNTARRRCGIAKQFFRDAMRRRLIAENPFADMKGVSVVANRSREYFISREEAAKVLDACPDAQWRLLFALSRYGGLRCPSEHLGLCWGDVQWDSARMVIRSPKTEHHQGKDERIVPIFPELKPYLEAVYDEAEEGTEHVITRYRDRNSNLRTQLERIIARAGLKPWPKLFQNLRATRETELAEKFPIHVVCAWLGNSQAVAAKHYLQTTDEHYEQAATEATGALHIPVQQPAATGCNEGKQPGSYLTISAEFSSLHPSTLVQVGDEGLEPPTFAV